MPIALDDVIKQVRDLPSLPAVITELLTSMDREDVDLQSLAKKITLDQALTAKTLRLANSSFYGMPSKVTTIAQAMSILGFRSIRTLLTACSVTSAFPATGTGSFDFQAFWRHSVGTAVAAQKLAPILGVNADTAFTAGLLHDIGALVLATRFKTQYDAMLAYRREHDCEVVSAEQAVLGIDHSMVGSALTAHWKFPPEMQQAVANHHAPEHAGASALTLVVHAANTLAHALDLTGTDDDLAPPLSSALWDALKLDAAGSAVLFNDIETAFHDMCQILVSNEGAA